MTQDSQTNRPCVNCKLVHETERAYLINDGRQPDGEGIWIPKSQSEIYPRSDGTHDLHVEEWIAKEKGLI